MNTTSFGHAGSIGDILASLPLVREHYKRTGKKGVYHLKKNIIALFPEGVTHPTRNDNGIMVLLNEEIITMLKPLIEAQPYIADVHTHNEEHIQVDFDAIRETFVNMPNGCLSRWYMYVFPDLACDLSEQWLEVPDSEKDLAKGKVIVTRTERYNNPLIDYSFLKEFEDELVFSGTMREYNNFCMNYDLNIPKLHVDNFLTLAQAIKQSRFHLSNQTMAFQISSGIKHPRILELCHYAPNVIPYGKDVFDFYAQVGLEYYFHRLNGTLDMYMNRLKQKAPSIDGAPVVNQ